SGKLDRGALQARLTAGGRPAAVPAAAAHDPVRLVAGQMSSLLRQPVDDDASFFGLGGNSLLAVELLSRLREHGLQLDFARFFRSPTPRGVAALATPVAAPAPARIRRVASGSAVPLTRQQLIPWLHRLAYPDSLAYNAQTMVVLRGRVDRASVQDAVSRLVDRHDALRLAVFEQPDGQPAQRAVDDVDLPVEYVDLSRLDPA